MVGHIYITGVIGYTVDEAGQPVKGIELVDVVEQVAKCKDCTSYYVHINSPGGSVNVGHSIASYVSTLPNTTTIAEGLCASIATEVHLAVPVENRAIQENTIYMIHNPLFQNITGNADELIAAAEELAKPQKELLEMYVKSTGLSKEAISGMMQQETQLSPDQCVSMGFASRIIPQYKAVAFLDKDQKNTDMEIKKELEKAKTSVAALLDHFKIKTDAKGQIVVDSTEDPGPVRNAVAAELETTDGKILTTPYEDLQVGDEILMDGAPAPDGDWSLVDGTIITVVSGKVDAISSPEADDPAAVLAAKDAEIAALKAQVQEYETEIVTLTNAVDVINKKLTVSSYRPLRSPAAVAVRGTAAPGDITKDSLKAKRAELKERRSSKE